MKYISKSDLFFIICIIFLIYGLYIFLNDYLINSVNIFSFTFLIIGLIIFIILIIFRKHFKGFF
jgi:hypothetical protein